MKPHKIIVILLALMLAAIIFVPIVSASDDLSKESAIKNAETAYQKEIILAAFGRVPSEKLPYTDLRKIDSDPWYSSLRAVNSESDKELQKYYYPNGPMIGKGIDMKGSIVVMINKDWVVNQSVLKEIYEKISEQGRQKGIENIPCRFISMGLMETQATRTEQIRPVIGGTKVHMAGYYSTLGFVATDSSGNRGIVATGHMGSIGSSVYQPDPTVSGAFIGYKTTLGNTYSDSSWTQLTSGVTSNPKVYESASAYKTFNYWDDNPSGLTLYMSGVESGLTTGSTVYQANVWNDHYGKYIQNQWYATYSSATGDSGAPVYEKYSTGETVLVGIHVGRSNGTGYAIFSPVQGIRRDLNWITPLTG
ncbi:hypothetical protein [Methanoregula sp. PtaB.Bin085]|uniref:hypothetical protein n=1 Tax=Methanoregula sp. PtaB.Bin085 TaxID=1811680 RepID=UPI0009CD1DB9|nr:hypothetical protein [Methanoregula sp. PtaB.Bin085]OPX65175.1 MAG: hypothetical protein A4E33_00206 [Methanoregula sp. PtaB.Bin085]